jgi:hypothetical protein
MRDQTDATADDARRPVSRVLSSSVLAAGRPFLWDAPCGAPHATNPDGGAGMPVRPLRARPSLFGLAPGGVYPATPVARGAVRSCRTVSPLPAGRRVVLARAVCFLWHCPWGRPRRRLAGTVFPWSPDFPLRSCECSGRPAVWRGRDARVGNGRQATRRSAITEDAGRKLSVNSRARATTRAAPVPARPGTCSTACPAEHVAGGGC